MPPPFISQQDLSDYLGRDVTSDNGALIAVDAACEICRGEAQQDFDQVLGDTIALDGSGSDVLLLPQRPVSNVGTVTVDGTDEPAFSFTAWGALYRGSAGAFPRPVWPRGRQNVHITYDRGAGTADIPRDVRMVALALAHRIVVQGAAVAETLGANSVRYAGPAMDLSTNELRILQRYRSARSV